MAGSRRPATADTGCGDGVWGVDIGQCAAAALCNPFVVPDEGGEPDEPGDKSNGRVNAPAYETRPRRRPKRKGKVRPQPVVRPDLFDQPCRHAGGPLTAAASRPPAERKN